MAGVAVHVVELLQAVEECFVAVRGQGPRGGEHAVGVGTGQHLGEGSHAGVGGEVRGGCVAREVTHRERQIVVGRDGRGRE